MTIDLWLENVCTSLYYFFTGISTINAVEIIPCASIKLKARRDIVQW